MYTCDCGAAFLTENGRNGRSAKCRDSETRVREALGGYEWRVQHE